VGLLVREEALYVGGRFLGMFFLNEPTNRQFVDTLLVIKNYLTK